MFFATDIHGSDVCWRKFVNAGKFYGARVLIMGGDLMGKMLVPITPSGARWKADFSGRTHFFQTRAEVGSFVKNLADIGFYTYECPEEELEHYADAASREQLIRKVALDRVGEWMAFADERLAETGIECFAQPGNDDLEGIEVMIEASSTVRNCDGRRVQLECGHELIATGYSNITPWATPRELSEDGLAALIDGLFADLERPETAIASLHVPPYGSHLDDAPLLDDNLRVQTMGGEPEMVPVGSTAVRDAILRYQPLLGLHGHIHEGQGQLHLGRTFCVNPGSEYQDATLKGALIRLDGGKVKNVQFIRG
jgi:uncharacterized protein